MKKIILSAALAGLSLCAQATVYEGSLLYNDGFTALATNPNTGWPKYSKLSWTVEHQPENHPEGFDWSYTYTLAVDKFAPLRWVIETGTGFTQGNIHSAKYKINTYEWADATDSITVGYFEQDNDASTPLRRDMPAERYGMFWNTSADTGGGAAEQTIITFFSDMAPMWGDLYANCGGNGNRGWNADFTTANPTDAPASGSIENHVLVPIPEPIGVLLFIPGTALLMAWRNRSRWTLKRSSTLSSGEALPVLRGEARSTLLTELADRIERRISQWPQPRYRVSLWEPLLQALVWLDNRCAERSPIRLPEIPLDPLLERAARMEDYLMRKPVATKDRSWRFTDPLIRLYDRAEYTWLKTSDQFHARCAKVSDRFWNLF